MLLLKLFGIQIYFISFQIYPKHKTINVSPPLLAREPRLHTRAHPLHPAQAHRPQFHHQGSIQVIFYFSQDMYNKSMSFKVLF